MSIAMPVWRVFLADKLLSGGNDEWIIQSAWHVSAPCASAEDVFWRAKMAPQCWDAEIHEGGAGGVIRHAYQASCFNAFEWTYDDKVEAVEGAGGLFLCLRLLRAEDAAPTAAWLVKHER